MDSVLENSRPLYGGIDDSVTRLSLFEMRYPKTMHPLHNQLVHSEHDVGVANVPEDSFVPPEDVIKVWNMQLSANAAEITENGFPYIQCSFPSGEKMYDQNCLEKIEKIYQMQNVKSDVQRELDWFSEDYLIPPSLQKYCLVPSRSRSLIWGIF